MDITIVLVIVVVFSFIVSHALERQGRLAALSTAVFLALGAIIGPRVTGWLGESTLEVIHPVLSLMLGMLGFSLGLMLRTHLNKTWSLPLQIIGALLVMGLTGAACFFFLWAVDGEMAFESRLGTSATVGILACVVSVVQIDEVIAALKASGPVTDGLRSYAVVSEMVAVLAFGVVAAFLRSNYTAIPLLGEFSALGWLFASVLIGIVSGGLFTIFMGEENSTSRVFLTTVGSVIFASGVAAGFGLSPLFVNFIAGATVAAFCRQAPDIERDIESLQRPIFVLLFILAGATWEPIAWILYAFVPIYLAARLLGLRVGTSLASAGLSGTRGGFGGALIAQSAFALAIALNFLQLRPSQAPFVLTVLLIAVLVQGPFSTRLLRRALANAEEIEVDFASILEPAEPEAPAAHHHHSHG